jgi:hypothetical protein
MKCLKLLIETDTATDWVEVPDYEPPQPEEKEAEEVKSAAATPDPLPKKAVAWVVPSKNPANCSEDSPVKPKKWFLGPAKKRNPCAQASPCTTPQTKPWRKLQRERKIHKAKFVDEVNLFSGTQVLPNQVLVKTWKVANIGTMSWDNDVKLVHQHGSLPSVEKAFTVPPAAPSTTSEVSAVVITPSKPGRYRAVFRLEDGFKQQFGPRMWCDICVVDEVNHQAAEQRQKELKKYKEAKKAEAAKAWQEMRAKKQAWKEMKRQWNREWEKEAKQKAWEQQRLNWKKSQLGQTAPSQQTELLRVYDM